MFTKKSLKPILILIFGTLVGTGCGFFAQVLLARKLGPYEFGVFSASFAAVTILSPLGGFGLNGFWLRVFTEEGNFAKRWISTSYKYIGITLTFTMAILLVWVIAFNDNPAARGVVSILAVCAVGQTTLELVTSKFQLKGQYGRLAVWQAVQHAARLIAVLVLFYFFNLTANSLTAALTFSFIAILIVCIGSYHLWQLRKTDFPQGKADGALTITLPSIANVAKFSWPYGIAGFLYLIYFQSNIVLLGFFDKPESAGSFSIALMFVSATYLIPSIVYQRFLLPDIHRLPTVKSKAHRDAFQRGNKYMLIIGLFIAIPIALTSEYIIDILLGDQYPLSAAALTLLCSCIPARFLSSSCGAFLSAGTYIADKVKIMSCAAAICVITGTSLIPTLGVKGAIVATISTEIFLMASLYFYCVRFIFTIKPAEKQEAS